MSDEADYKPHEHPASNNSARTGFEPTGPTMPVSICRTVFLSLSRNVRAARHILN
jgi:hypothetical protein